jgi:hypothetical protein
MFKDVYKTFQDQFLSEFQTALPEVSPTKPISAQQIIANLNAVMSTVSTGYDNQINAKPLIKQFLDFKITSITLKMKVSKNISFVKPIHTYYTIDIGPFTLNTGGSEEGFRRLQKIRSTNFDYNYTFNGGEVEASLLKKFDEIIANVEDIMEDFWENILTM